MVTKRGSYKKKKGDHKKKQKEKPCNLRSSSRIDLNIFMKRI